MSHRIGFIVLPGYSPMTLASAMEPLFMCNELTGTKTFEIFTVSLGKSSPLPTHGFADEKTYTLKNAPPADTWIVAGTYPARHPKTPGLDEFLQRKVPHANLGGIASGSYTLAKAGLLDGYRGVVHCMNDDELIKKNRTIVLSDEQFIIDRDRLTSRGGSSSLDLMLMWIATQVNPETAESLVNHFVHERHGRPVDEKLSEMSERTRVEQPKLAEALELMENNIEEPLKTDDIASLIKISRRHLERLFKKYLKAVPSRYYLQIRLNEAHRRLSNSSDSISEIGLGCGFSSAAHFSTVYRTKSGLTPSEARNLNQMIQIDK